MRIVFLTHYFHPEGNAPATRVTEMTRRWVAAGHDVTVITGVPNVPDGVVYEGYRNRWLQRETRDGVSVVRVWTYLAPNKGTARRIANYLSFMVTAALAGLFVRRPDVVIATSPQFFCGWAGVIVTALRRLPFVLEIRDIWPESIEAVGAMGNRRLLRALEWLEHRMYAVATRIVTVGDGYRGKLVERGVDAQRIDVIPNGVDLGAFAAGADGSGVRERYRLGDHFVCAYLGTIGMGCGLDVVLRAAQLLRERGRDDVRFLLVGDGAVREELEARAHAEGLDERVIFTGRQPKNDMPAFLAATDACLVHLTRTELFKTVLPSKIFEGAAMGKPIILGVEGFAAELVASAEAGICIQPENEHELVEATSKLAADPALARRLGAAGHERIASRYTYDRLAAEYEQLLIQLAAGERRP
jgi:glycosyltransferase involved in cell wall biosynthesis